MIEPPHAHDRRLVAWLSLAQLISWGSLFYAFALFMEPVERALGLSRVQSSLAFSLALLVEGLVAYPVGRWIDQGHERVVITVGSVAAAVGLAWHSQISSLAGFYAVWAWLGAAMAAILYAPVFSVVTRRFPHDFRRAIITLTFFGRSGQHGVHPSDRQSDPWFGVATGVDVAGLNAVGGVCAAAFLLSAPCTTRRESRVHVRQRLAQATVAPCVECAVLAHCC